MIGQKHQNVPLTKISVAYKNSEYIGDLIFKRIQVVKTSDNYNVFTADFRIPETERANGSTANRLSWGLSTSSYNSKDNALADVITDRDKENVDAPIVIEKETVEFLTDKLLSAKEKKAAAILFTTTSFSNNNTLATATSWATSGANPIADIDSATSVIIKASAKRPNTMVLGRDAFVTLKNNSNIYNRIQYAGKLVVTEDILSALFGIDKLLVGNHVSDATDEGLTETADLTWGDDCWLGYIAPIPGRKTPSAVYQMGVGGRYTKKWREEDIDGEVVEVGENYTHRVIASSAAYLIKDVTVI